jgi:hypothetical protein
MEEMEIHPQARRFCTLLNNIITDSKQTVRDAKFTVLSEATTL